MATTSLRSHQLLEARQTHVARGVGVVHPIVVASASGATVWDVDGRAYVDFAAGIGVLNVGHNHPRVTQAVRAQLERLGHMAFQVATYEPYVALAERLNRIAPVRGPAKTMLVTTGVEAVENAVKIARAATGRPAVVAFHHGFHGRTLLGMTLTGKVKPYRQGFGPFAPEVHHAPYPYPYRGWDAARALAAFDELLEAEVAPDRVAAVVIEPVLGEGGFVPAPPAFLQALRARADEHGFLLVVDEIQSGFGRTGRMFALEHAGVEADLVTVAKSLAGGLPLAGVVGSARHMDAPAPGGLGGTYAGNPLACAAALAVLDVFDSEDVVARAQVLGDRMRAELEAAAARHGAVGEVRGLGAMLAVEFVRDRDSREPDAAAAAAVVAEARARGLLLLTAGMHGNVVRLLAPLIIDDDALGRGVAALHAAIDAALAPQPVA